jgi:predicted ATPase
LDEAWPDRTPVTLVTGFLGSGKTTLLQRILREPAFSDTAVLINELGEIALDHQLLFGTLHGIYLTVNHGWRLFRSKSSTDHTRIGRFHGRYPRLRTHNQ